ncbi:MAG: hypothetical protein N2204_02515 [Anaerolineae bacterium]|nr:hypothetical protein [Anaerolineae bacterium]
MAEPVLIEIIAYAPTAFYHCTHCEVAWRAYGMTNRLHDEQVASSLPNELAADYQAVSDWVHQVLRRYCDRVMVKVIDAASLEGFFKTLRYRVHRYPAVVIGKAARFAGPVHKSLPAADQELSRRLADSLAVRA